jgi:hypothetical protein
MVKVLILAASIALAACQTTPKGSFCDIAKPIRLSGATVDTLTDAEVEKVLAHNSKLQRLCGVKP